MAGPRFLLTRVKKIIKFIVRPFTEWKVFNQILVIISITSALIVVQGYLGLKMFDTMKKMVSDVFSQSTHGLQYISGAKIQLEQLQSNYLAVLTERSTLNLKGLTLYLTESKNRINYMKSFNAKSAANVMNIFDELVEIVNQPPSEVRFERLKQLLKSGYYELDILETSIQDSTAGAISRCNIYSAASQRNFTVILILSVTIPLALGFLLARSVSKPLNLVVDAAQSLAGGNLTAKTHGKGCREVTETIVSIDKAISSLRKLISHIDEQATTLLAACQGLKQSSAESGYSAQQVAQVMERLSETANEQIEQMSTAAKTVEDLSELVRKVSADTQNIAVVSGNLTNSAKSGEEVVRNIFGKINEVYLVTRDVADVIKELSGASEEIGEIITIIRGIAEQTTLIALNAAIEAARAGINGKGFGVVAKETGKLANQSKEATGMIEDLIIQMQTKTRYAVEAMEQGMSKVEEGKGLAQGAMVTFEQIFQTLNQNLERMDMLVRSSQKMAENNEIVNKMIANFAASNEESMSSVKDVTAVSIQQSASSQQVATLSDELSSIAFQLKQSVAAFVIK